MSREEWILVRNTPRKNPPGRYVWVSKRILLVTDRDGVTHRVAEYKGRTYRKPQDDGTLR